MKIIFLDIDGVLNSPETAIYFYEKYGKDGYGGLLGYKTHKITKEDTKFGEFLVNNLKTIVKETNAKIVISSTWRMGTSVELLKEAISLYDWNAPVIDKTAVLRTGLRGDEINQWLIDHDGQVDSYVILDDDSDMLPDQMDNFVQTDGLKGLSEDNAKKAIKILNR